MKTLRGCICALPNLSGIRLCEDLKPALPCRSGGYNGGYYSRSPFSTFINLSDLFFYWDPYYYRRRGVYTTQNSGEMNFFESVFSFGALLPVLSGDCSVLILGSMAMCIQFSNRK